MTRNKARARLVHRVRSPPPGRVELQHCPWAVAWGNGAPSDHRSPPPVEPATHAFLKFLYDFGFDSRLGLVCCSPVYVAGKLCLLYSPNLVSALSSALSVSLENWEHDFSYRTWFRSSFFPHDVRLHVRTLAPAHLPLYGGHLDAARCLDAAAVCAVWKTLPTPPVLGCGGTSAQLVVAKRFLARKRHSQAPGQPKLGGAALPSLGMPLFREAMDFRALSAVVEDHLGHARASWHEHVCWGWRPAGGATVRSRLCVEHDAFYGYKVAELEVVSGSAVPFPRLLVPTGCERLGALLADDPPEWLVEATDGRAATELCSSVLTAQSASCPASTIGSGAARES